MSLYAAPSPSPAGELMRQAFENQAGDLEGASDGEARSKLSSVGVSAMSAPVQTDSMELTRTISQLASANQQLASAHNLALAHLQWLYTELTKAQSTGATACPKCKSQEREIKNSVSGKARTLLVKQSSIGKSTSKKSRRLRRLPNFDESRDAGEREEQRLLIERLTQDYNSTREECERKEKNLEELTEKLKRSESESGRLLAELETFQGERLNIERLVREETEKSSELRARLVEQEEQGRKHLQQIRALELAVQATRRSPKSVDEDAAAASSSSQVQPANEEFKKELMLKREARQRAIAGISSEMDRLRRELEAEKVAHAETTKALESLRENQAKAVEDRVEKKTDDDRFSERIEAIRLSDLLKVSDEIRSELWLQVERTDDLRFHLENEPDEHRVRIGSLRRLAEETRATLRTRKQQSNQLKDRLAQLMARLGDRVILNDNDEIREEAERQLEDVARSRQLCDERSRILAELKDQCSKEMHELKVKLESSRKENQGLEEELHKTEDKMDAQDAEILNLESQLGLAKADCRDLQNQMSLINSLFTQMLLSASSAEMDLDRLTRLLQENHDLISGMAKETGSEAAALPKLLLDIIEQVDGRSRENEKTEEDDQQEENIAHNLPKVWRVLLELLSCHAAGTNSEPATAAAESAPDSCYKSVDTPTGPRLVISVSKTYIRLKELILEKKHLEKEMNRMKQLNSHLESKLSEQEKRLSTVSDELSKTWNIVGRMQVQHQQLHTHEKILRYELQQKRKMLQELKQELEYCREKWESARQKNTNTEIEWRSLRREFAARKALASHSDSFNNSGESGFSDDREESDDDEDDDGVAKRVRPVNSRRRSRKDGSRPSLPEPESEQPTDNELSESKTASSLGSGQRTPTPETEAETEVIEEDPLPTVTDQPENSDTAAVDPLAKALSNVIESLISTDESQPTECVPESSGSVQKISVEAVLPTETPVSVFSIGPFPNQSLAMKNVQFSNPLVMGPSTSTSTSNSVAITSSDDVTSAVSSSCVESVRGAIVPEPSTSSTTTEALDARAARLRSLEEQAQWLVRKVSDTNRRGSALSSRLEELHETYGSMPAAPPMPDVLPTFRINTEIDEISRSDESDETPRQADPDEATR